MEDKNATHLIRLFNSRLVLVFLLILAFSVSVSSGQILYDDGTKEADLQISQNGYAVRVTPTNAGMLTSLDAYLNETSGTAKIAAFAMDSGHLIQSLNTPLDVAGGGYSWQNFSLPNIEFLSEFYVGVGKNWAASNLLLGADTTAPTGRSEYASGSYDTPAAYGVNFLNNYMIRANLNYYPTVSGIVITDPTNTNPTLSATCTDQEDTIVEAWYSVDSGIWLPMNATDGTFDSAAENVDALISIGGLADGTHNVEIKCRDSASYLTKPAATTTFFLDTVLPKAHKSYNPPTADGNNNWYKTDVEITLTANDPAPKSGVDYIEYELTGATIDGPNNCGPGPCIFTVSNEGKTWIKFRAYDNAGNTGTLKQPKVKIDKTPPTAPVLNSFPNDYISATTETVSWIAATDTASGINYYKVYREVDDSGTFTFIGLTKKKWYIDTGLVEGKYNYYVTAVDKAGYESVPSNSDWFVVDMSNPDAPVLDALPGYTGSTTVALNWTPPADNPPTYQAGIASHDVNKDNSIIANVAMPTTNYNDGGNADATTHDYLVRAQDAASPVNIGPWSNQETTTIDVTAPTTTHSLNPAAPDGLNGWYVSTVDVTLNASDSGSGVANTYYCVDTTDTCTPTTPYTVLFTVSAEGTNYVRYYSVDNVGNLEGTHSTGAIKIDLTRPYNQSILLDGGATYNTTGTVNAAMDTGTDDISGLYYCEINWNNGMGWLNIGLATADSRFYFTDGLKIAQYRCYDMAGWVSQPPVQDDIIIDRMPPFSDTKSLVAMQDIIKGKTIISGTAFDVTSGVAFVEVMIMQLNQNDGTWFTVLPWTMASGTTSWSYEWDNSAYPTTTFKIYSRATDNVAWQETIMQINKDEIRVELIENTAPYMENIFYEGTSEHVLLYGFLDRTNWDYTVEIFDAADGLSGTAVYSYPVTTDNNAYFGLDIDASSWDQSKLYTARIALAGGEIVYSQFDALYYSYQISVLDQRLQWADANIIALWEDDANKWLAIADLNAEIINIYNELDIVYQRLDDLEADVSYLKTKVIDLQNQIDALTDILKVMNHATINIFYNATTNRLNVWGEAPYGTMGSIGMALLPTDDPSAGSDYTATTVVSGPNNSYQFTALNGNPVDTTVLQQDKSYNVLVFMYSPFSPGIPYYLVGTIFDTLAVDTLEERVNDLNEHIQLVDANIAALWLDSEDQEQRIEDLEEDVSDIFDELDEINDRLDDLEDDVNWLKMRVHQLQNQINFLRFALKAMNHATINIFYNATTNRLNVWGEAAFGTAAVGPMPGDVGLVLLPTDDPSMGPDYMDFTNLTGPNHTYQFTALNGNPIDTTVLQPESYNVFVFMFSDFRPMGAPPIYIVGTIFDTLAIDDLQKRLLALEEKVEKLDDGTIEFHYDSINNLGTAHGEAPTEANCVRLWAFTASGTFLGTAKTAAVQNASGDDYSLTAYVGNWPQEALNVYADFYESSNCSGGYISTVNDTVEALLSEDLFGFRDITVSSYVTSYYVNTVKVPITFALKPDRGDWYGGMWYRIGYRNNPGQSWRPLVPCSYYPEGVKTYMTGNLTLYITGVKRVNLRAVGCGPMPPIEDYRSYTFRIRHVDLKDSLTAYTTIVSPIENSDMSYSYPVGSIEDNVYWTQSGSVPLESYLLTNTEEDRPVCEAYYYDSYGVERHIGNYATTQDNPMKWVCDAGQLNFGTQEWENENYAGNYTTIRVYNDVVAQPDGFDEIKVGIDNNAPSINSITPDASGIMNGIYRWYADITDDLSGIAYVDFNTVRFYLIEKQDYNYCIDGNCWTGDGTVVWNTTKVDFNAEIEKFYYDLNTLNFPDGDYNVGFKAKDIAGNESYVEVDPIIDNTKPVIGSWSMSPTEPVRGEMISFQASVSDNLSGVNSVVVIIDDGCTQYSATMPRTSGNAMNGIYKGSIDTNNDFADGPYTFEIKATDKATNEASVTGDFNMLYGMEKGSIIVAPETATVTCQSYNDANSYYQCTLNGGGVQEVRVFMNGEWITLDLNVVGNRDLIMFPGQGLIVSPQNATVSGASWNDGTKELAIDANGTGTQEIVVYVNGNGNPNTIIVDGTTITSWSYDAATQTVTFTMEFGSTHGFSMSWYVPPAPTPPATPAAGGGAGGGGGGGGGASTYHNYIDIEPETAFVGEEVTAKILCEWVQGCKLALIEDGEKEILTTYPQNLREQTYTISFSTTGEKTLQLLKNSSQDLLLDEDKITIVEEGGEEEEAEEEAGLCAGVSCNDANPCTYDGCLEGECGYTNAVNGTICYADGLKGSCLSGVCMVETVTTAGAGVGAQPAVTAPAGFFGLADNQITGGGLLILGIILGVGWFVYMKIMKSNKK